MKTYIAYDKDTFQILGFISNNYTKLEETEEIFQNFENYEVIETNLKMPSDFDNYKLIIENGICIKIEKIDY